MLSRINNDRQTNMEFLFSMGKVKQQRLDFNEDFNDYFPKGRRLNNFLLQQVEDREIFHILVSSNEAILLARQERKAKAPNVDREQEKVWWRNVTRNWSNKQFSVVFRICRETFQFILNIIQPFIIKVPTNLVPNPIDPEKHLALTLHCLAHECSFIVISNLFGFSNFLVVKTFNKVLRELVMNMCNHYIKLPTSEEERA